MATVTQVTMGRIDHYRVTRLHPDESATEAGECECGAIWIRADNEVYDLFSDWMMYHPKPTVVRAWIQCAGTHGLIRAEGVDGNGVGWCPKCERYRPTSQKEGYEGWYEFDPHPVFVAVKP